MCNIALITTKRPNSTPSTPSVTRCVVSCVISCVVRCVTRCVFSCVFRCVIRCVVRCVIRCAVGGCRSADQRVPALQSIINRLPSAHRDNLASVLVTASIHCGIHIFTALHGMQSRYSDGISVCLSVCQTIDIYQDIYLDMMMMMMMTL